MDFTWQDSHFPLYYAEGKLHPPGKINDSYSRHKHNE